MMTERMSPQAEVIAAQAGNGPEPLEWEQVREAFAAERWYWVATAGANLHPHLRPVLAVWADGCVYSTTSAAARKGRDLEANPSCSLAARAPALDIVIEGTVRWVNQQDVLEQVAAAYRAKYGWPVTVTAQNAFDAPYGAPTAGLPPYLVYDIVPATVYAFGTGDDLGQRSTRFRFRTPAADDGAGK
ncbi:MAG TPA: pyridoxamine 5'-phosphate oxidase family protein [Trebonia sp.]